MKTIAIIPARGGSKGLEHKNIHQVLGKPLIVYSIEQALYSTHIQRVVVSTDDPQIAAVSRQAGAEIVMRPAELSADTSPSEDALRYTLNHLVVNESYHPDLVCFLQCTSPVRHPEDLDRAFQLLESQAADSLLSVVPFHLFIWQEVEGKGQSLTYDYRQRSRRQDRTPEFIENGSFYVFRPWVLEQLNNRLGGKIVLYKMPESSLVDIHTLDDILWAERVLRFHIDTPKLEDQ